MAQSNCIRCKATSFELVESHHVGGTGKIWMLLQCSSCGGVVGSQEAQYVSTVLHNQDIRLEAMSAAIKAIAQQLNVYVKL